MHLDYHVRSARPTSASTHPAPQTSSNPHFLSARRPSSRSGPGRLGPNSVGPGCAVLPDSHRLPADTCLRPSLSVFRVPTTHDVVTALFHPSYPKSHIDIVNLGLLALQLILFYTLPRTPRKIFFFLYFAFWRAAYDAGLGYVLTKQSKRKWIVRTVHKLGWLDENRRPEVRAWIRRQLVGKMGKDYSFDVRSYSVSIPFVASTHRVVAGTSARVQHLAALPPSCRYHLDQVSLSILIYFGSFTTHSSAISYRSVCLRLPASAFPQTFPCSFMLYGGFWQCRHLT